MNFINKYKLFSVIFLGILFIYTLSILVFNVHRGFDITDESYYILNATYPSDIFSVVTHEGFYTKILYFFSGYNLAYFRLLGIFVLLLSSLWLAIELMKYISNKFEKNYDIWDKIFHITTICLSSLLYYKWWLLTPSYNWLALISVILVATMLFKIINNFYKLNGHLISFEYFGISFFFSMSFMAKPTTTIVLGVLILLFIIYERKKLDIKRGIICVSIMILTITFLHIQILDGGVYSYYHRLIESLYRINLMGTSHGISKSFFAIFDNIEQVIKNRNPLLSLKNLTLLFIIYLLLLSFLYKFRHKINISIILNIFMHLVVIIFTYLVLKHNILIYGIEKIAWLGSIYLMLILYLFYFSTLLFMKHKINFFKLIIKTIPISFIIILMSVAVSFGTGNNIVFQSNIAFIFPVISIVILSFVLDKSQTIVSIRFIASICISFFVVFSIKYAYENPYRLNTSISKQNEYVNFLGGIKVDIEQKKYIENLRLIKEKYMTNNKEIVLLDLTRMSPGVNIILDAKFIETSWLLNGYRKTSREFAYRILKNANKLILEKAWILIPVSGKISLDLKLLNSLGLKFPDNYMKIGTVFLKSRNETQELWVPNVK